MFLTSEPNLFEKVTTLSNHGRGRAQTKQFWADIIGYKFKMSNVQAAIGCAQMQRIDALTARKREILHAYKLQLTGIDGVMMNPEQEHALSGAWMPTVVFSEDLGIKREAILAAFQDANIDARVFFYPLSDQPMFTPVPDNTQARSICARAINLPSYHDMTNADIDRVCAVIKHLVGT